MKSETFLYFMAIGMFVVAGVFVLFAGYPLLGGATAWFGIGLAQLTLCLKCD